MHEPEKAEEEAFWRFSLAFYEGPGVAEALIALQDRDGFDVNLMLFALWLGIFRSCALNDDLLGAAEGTAGMLRSEIVEPLRQLRRRLRRHPDGDVQKLREGVKALELEGEKLIQARLVGLAGRGHTQTLLEDGRDTAHANLALYLGSEGVRSGEAAVIFATLDAFARDL
jgi:uncharacterized protein (TIGR02444 family)